MITGQGGNIGVSVGDDGVFMIDDQYAPLSARINKVIKGLSEKPIRFVLNTHWHADHTGGNENFGKTGAVIVAHANTRKRMSTEQFLKAFNRRVPASPKAALPVVTFTKSVTFHWNGDELNVFHVEHAHTDGDVVIHFKQANVFHMGDCYFSDRYPFIDTSSGDTLAGVVACADRVLALANQKTKIIPGHGPLSTRSQLKEWRDMLEAVHQQVHALKKAGKSVDEVIAAKPTKDFDEKWNGGRNADGWVSNIYGAVKKK
ncbi:MAG: MBL fold metallo-hydrolase [Planctomycetes bacterium]|nr:MBL fold metallo-hydrolase [Planctomycetota bacterium]